MVEAFEQLHHEQRDLVSWSRQLPVGLGAELEAWVQQGLPRFDEIIDVAHPDLSPATKGIAEPFRTWLTTDITALSTQLAHMLDASRLRVSFGPILTDQCRKFHADYLRYRLMTTYVGPGTQWVPEHAVCRDALMHPPGCPCDANKEIVRDPNAIQQAAAGEVVLAKGSLHPDGGGAVHRSPPIEDKGLVRVVLIVSTVDNM